MTNSKDLFDDSTMSFGEHLEVLRVHLWKAIVGLMIGVILALFFGDRIVAIIRGPIDRALREHGTEYSDKEQAEKMKEVGLRELIQSWFEEEDTTKEEEQEQEDEPLDRDTIKVSIKTSELARALNELDPQKFPKPPPDTDQKEDEAKSDFLTFRLSAPEFADFRHTSEKIDKPITLNVQEAFLTYLKVAFVAGLVLTSPWVFYQIWQFVAAGLYPHEQKYVYRYLPISVGLFVGGAVFCFTMVFPFVLEFLLGFNKWLGVQPQIRLSEWISFALMLPLMFGISFQLPLVMLFLERISVFEAADYRAKRRMSILVIAILSMLLTPADPMSMLMMMFPLLFLYELGILFCQFSAPKSPFEGEEL